MMVWLIAILVILASRLAAVAVAALQLNLLESAGVTELFIALPVFCMGVMAARALAQAGFNPLRLKSRQLTAEAEC